MNVLLLGSGAREHALCWAITRSSLCKDLYCAPGNAGIEEEAQCIPIQVEDLESLVKFCSKESIDFVVVGPEAPLVGGLIDKLTIAGIKAFGPSADAAKLEGSKSFTKEFCLANPLPDQCICENGKIGKFKIGFKGICICGEKNNEPKFNKLSKLVTSITAPYCLESSAESLVAVKFIILVTG